jgi:hypothetical protein
VLLHAVTKPAAANAALSERARERSKRVSNR